MLIRLIYMYLFGFISITVEGFFVERFMNLCLSQGIFLWNIQREKNTFLKVKISINDFKKIKKIAKKTKCRVKIEKKVGVPFIAHRYRKRKIVLVVIGIFTILLFGVTRFIWNIEIIGTEKIDKSEIESLLKEQGLETGKLKNKINTEEAINQIRLKREDIGWIGIKIQGTNATVQIVETKEKPEIIDENEVCNIVADKTAVVSKIIVQNGTPRVAVGDTVNKGDLLVEGVMEGKYTGVRNVHAEANVFGKIMYEKTKKESLIQEIENRTGNEEKKLEINLNNFQIILPKGVSKFKNYDTIRTYKKIRVFSNYYFPISINRITNLETKKEFKKYTPEELIEKMKKVLEEELKKEYNLQEKEESALEERLETNVENQTVEVKVIYILQEEIGTKENL